MRDAAIVEAVWTPVGKWVVGCPERRQCRVRVAPADRLGCGRSVPVGSPDGTISKLM
ncbi:hypothetical protein FB558_3726 [Pseudonocardia kunmingensis]|uniref:Uncharacterized protein n=1 Tax=Pseudonocardia kunmingensis TaxID=630975 RepID=A0A543DPF6_9PSEU|nr:hypothetical protein FB558_3726 [Pseudonocardia kunmingensis]